MSGATEIAFNVPEYSGAEIEHVRKSLASGHTSSNHEFSQKAREILQAETGAAEVLLTTSCTAALEMSAMLLDLEAGRHRDRAVVHVHLDGARLRPRGRPHPLLRHRAAHPRAGPAQRRGAARRLGPRGGGGALRRHRLRHGRPARGAGRPSRRVRDRGQRARALRPVARRAARLARPVRHPELPRHQELHLRRGRGARRRRHRGRRPGLGALRQGHRPAGVLPRPGGQVLLARQRLLLRARGPARRDPDVPARAAGVHPGPASRRVRPLPGRPHAVRRASSASGCRTSPTTACRPTTSSTCCCRTPRCGAP